MSSPVITTSLVRIQTDPQGVSPFATAFFEKKTVLDDQSFIAPLTSVNWPLMSDKKVTVNGVEYTYSEVSAAVTAIAYQESADQAAAAQAAADALAAAEAATPAPVVEETPAPAV